VSVLPSAISRQFPLSVIPAKRSASRNPARFGGNDLHFRQRLDSLPGLLSAGVTFLRGNDRSLPSDFLLLILNRFSRHAAKAGIWSLDIFGGGSLVDLGVNNGYCNCCTCNQTLRRSFPDETQGYGPTFGDMYAECQVGRLEWGCG
jgi:hypothetical protein